MVATRETSSEVYSSRSVTRSTALTSWASQSKRFPLLSTFHMSMAVAWGMLVTVALLVTWKSTTWPASGAGVRVVGSTFT